MAAIDVLGILFGVNNKVHRFISILPAGVVGRSQLWGEMNFFEAPKIHCRGNILSLVIVPRCASVAYFLMLSLGFKKIKYMNGAVEPSGH